MPLFDETMVEASHHRLASLVFADIRALTASTDLATKALLAQDFPRSDADEHRKFLAASVVGFRLIHGAGATTKLIDAGYFVQAIALMRDIAELGMLYLDFSEHPDHLIEWSRSAGKYQNRKFRAPKLRERISDKAKVDFLDDYFDFFSELGTHPSSISIQLHHGVERFHIGPHVNAKLFATTYRELSRLVWHVCDAGGIAYKALFDADPAETHPQEFELFVSVLREIPVRTE